MLISLVRKWQSGSMLCLNELRVIIVAQPLQFNKHAANCRSAISRKAAQLHAARPQGPLKLEQSCSLCACTQTSTALLQACASPLKSA
jgi:hypothetical protein